MSGKLLTSACALASVLLMSCAHENKVSIDIDQSQFNYLTAVTDVKYFDSSDEFVDFISESVKEIESESLKKMLIGAIALDSENSVVRRMSGNSGGGEAQLHIEKYNFTYKSVDPSGNPIILSGALMLPNHKDRSGGYVIDDITLYNQYWIDANYASTLVGTPVMLRTVFNQAVVSSDFQGFGVDYGKHHHPFFEFYELARQSIDCQLAAMELMKYLGVKLSPDYGTYSMGQSKGAPVTMAVQKMLENSEPDSVRNAVRLKSSFCTTGAYNLVSLMKEYLESGESTHLWVLTMMVMGTYYSYPDQFQGVKLEDFFTDELNNATIERDGVTYSLYGWIDAGRTLNLYLEDRYAELGIDSVHEILAPRFFDADGNVNYKDPLLVKLMSIWAENNTSDGWSPQTPILYFHSTYDNFVKYDISYQCYLNMAYNEGVLNNNVKEITYNLSFLEHGLISGYAIVLMMQMIDPVKIKQKF